MFLTSIYPGEAMMTLRSQNPPVPLVFEWHRWLLDTLGRAGFTVIVKGHPKGLQGQLSPASVLAPFCERTLSGHFDPLDLPQVDCLIFDYAGTAFADALAANIGIVLLDLGVRPIDPGGAELLDARVERVSCHFNRNSHFRVNQDELMSAIDRASQGDKLERAAAFVDAYFAA